MTMNDTKNGTITQICVFTPHNSIDTIIDINTPLLSDCVVSAMHNRGITTFFHDMFTETN